MSIRDLLTEDVIVSDMKAVDKKSALAELCEKLAERRPDLDRARMVAVLLDRERLGSTGIGHGVAIPHGKLPEIDGLVTAFGRSRAGVDFASMDDLPAHLFFVLFAPAAAARVHLDALAKVSRLLQDQEVRDQLMDAPSAAAMLATLEKAEARLQAPQA
jgi:nitrogen PTS system EIIA component